MAGRWEWIVDTADLRIGVTTSRRERTTSTVVVAGGQALLVDPAWDPDELAWIAADLADSGITVTAGFATHAHHDHVLWHPALGAAPRWASAQVARAAAADRIDLLAGLGPAWPGELHDLVGLLTEVREDVLPWPVAAADATGIRLITHHAHAPGHTALWLPAVRVLLAGDMLSDVELPLLEKSSPADYLTGLTALRPFVEQALAVVPGHGTPAIGIAAAAARWAADLRYLVALSGTADPVDRRLALSGTADPVDRRLALAGMADAHRQNRARVAARPT